MAKKREAQAYVPNSTKSPTAPQGKYKVPRDTTSRVTAPQTGDQSEAPATAPAMQPSVPEGKYKLPDPGSGRPMMPGTNYTLGDQSMPPQHKKAALPMQNAPVDVKGVNAGADYPLPKSGGKGETEV